MPWPLDVFRWFDVSFGEKYTFASRYFRAITEYMQQLRHSLGELRDDIEYDLTKSLNLVEIKMLMVKV